MRYTWPSDGSALAWTQVSLCGVKTILLKGSSCGASSCDGGRTIWWCSDASYGKGGPFGGGGVLPLVERGRLGGTSSSGCGVVWSWRETSSGGKEIFWWLRVGRLAICRYALMPIQHIFHYLHSSFQIPQLTFILAPELTLSPLWFWERLSNSHIMTPSLNTTKIFSGTQSSRKDVIDINLYEILTFSLLTKYIL